MFYIFFKFFVCVLSFYIRSLKQTEGVTFSTLSTKKYFLHYFLFICVSLHVPLLSGHNVPTGTIATYQQQLLSVLRVLCQFSQHPYYKSQILWSTPKLYTSLYFLQSKNINLGHLNTKVLIYKVTKHLLGMMQLNTQKFLMI